MHKTFTREHSNRAKGLAILLLLSYHLFENEKLITSMAVNHAPFSLEGFLVFTQFGNVCVSVFVFLTAFGITSGLLGQEAARSGFSAKSVCRQSVHRFLRLMLNFVFLYLSVNLLWWYKFDYRSLYGMDKQGILFFLTDAAGLSMFFEGSPTLNATWWYMEIAYLLIFLVPLLAWLVTKTGYSLLIFAWFAPMVITFHPDISRYLFEAAFGGCAACGKWPEKLLNLRLSPLLQWILGLAGFVLCVLIRQNYVVHEYYIHLADAPIALFLVYFGSALAGSIPLLGKFLAFVGKHAMNIYLVHTFFYMSLWQPYIYHFKYAWATFLLLLALCLLYSVLLEAAKRLTRFEKLLARLR